jgi:hypothetical protein
MAPTNISMPMSVSSEMPQTVELARCSFTPVDSMTTWSRSSRKFMVGPTLTPWTRGASASASWAVDAPAVAFSSTEGL